MVIGADPLAEYDENTCVLWQLCLYVLLPNFIEVDNDVLNFFFEAIELFICLGIKEIQNTGLGVKRNDKYVVMTPKKI
jgi:hypothetical protein